MVHGWVTESRPRVAILTDGSGRAGESRLQSSEQIVGEARGDRGPLWGLLSDQAFYRHVLEGNVNFFTNLATRICGELVAVKPPFVAGDAREGINSTHDLCRMVIDAAVRLARRQGVIVGNFAFTLYAPHGRAPRAGAIYKSLTDAELTRKIDAARAYPELVGEAEAVFSGTRKSLFENHPDLAAKIDIAMDGMNERALAIECFASAEGMAAETNEKPFYELYGERLVASGIYKTAIRYREHVLPIERALASMGR